MNQSADHLRDGLRIDVEAARAGRRGLVAAVLGFAVAFVFGFFNGWDVFFRSYLLNYCYFLSLALGALFFVMLQHLTRAGWSVTVRRLAELIAAALPWWALLFVPMLIPVLAQLEGVYAWTAPEIVAGNELLQHKQPYLNAPFFIARCALYFLVWSILARFFLRCSTLQDDSGDVHLTLRMQWWSAPGMLLYAITVTFFSVDALMSLNPEWYSTIWGVYFFAGSLVGFFALLALLIFILQRGGRLRRVITVEHFHDVGKLAFGFVVFWAYIMFSQYLLIWYANIPEETSWYHVRQASGWWVGVSLVLLFGHFFAPFLALISRVPKRRKGMLALAAVWLLVVHWIDLYYVVIPRPLGHGAHLSPLHVSDLALLLGLGGLFVYAITRPMTRYALVPERDPRLHEALAFQNV